MRRIKLLVYFLLIAFIGYLFYHYSAVKYGIGQAMGQLKIIQNTKAIAELRNDSASSDSLLKRFELIDAIRTFAEDSLSLNVGNNYTTFYDQKGKPILWSVTASPEFEIKAYQWEFPIAGSFPYKGFFDHKKALEEEKKLKTLGYDTEIGEVSAWSTLGILNDPILSSMLQRPDGKLAELIIHESTHSTIYLKDQGQFNENLASFIGRKGADLFLINRYGEKSKERLNYQDQLKRNRIFKDYMREAIQTLQLSYKKIEKDWPYKKKRELKAQYITELKEGLKATAYFSNDSIAGQRLAHFHPNNAYFSGFSTYANDQSIMEVKLEQEFNGDLRSMILSVKEKGLSLFNE